MRSLRVLLPLTLLALGGCALRPRYTDLVTPQLAAAQVKLVLLQAPERAPLAGVKVEMSEGKSRYSAVTAADGSFSLPVTKAYRDENPILVVATPPGVASYRVEVAPEPQAVPAEGPAEAPAPAAEPMKM